MGGVSALLAALVLSYLLLPAVNTLERKGFSRRWAILFLYALLLLGFSFLALLLLPSVGELRGATSRMHLLLREGAEMAEGRWPLLAPLVREGYRWLEFTLDRWPRSLFSFLRGNVFLFLAPVIAYYFLRDFPSLSSSLLSRLPPSWRDPFCTLVRELDLVVGKFLRGQLAVALGVGVLSGLGLALLGVPYAPLLGFLAGFADLIPYLGPFLGALPGVVVAGGESLALAWKAAGVYFLVQQVENAFLVPRLVGEKVGLSPFWTLGALLLGADIGGPLGIVMAVPVAASLRALGRFLGQLYHLRSVS